MAAYRAGRRVRDFGVRIALGANTSHSRLVLRDGNATALLGLTVGLLVANWAEQFIAYFLFGFDDAEPYLLAVSVVVLFVATIAAGIPPAVRASRINAGGYAAVGVTRPRWRHRDAPRRALAIPTPSAPSRAVAVSAVIRSIRLVRVLAVPVAVAVWSACCAVSQGPVADWPPPRHQIGSVAGLAEWLLHRS